MVSWKNQPGDAYDAVVIGAGPAGSAAAAALAAQGWRVLLVERERYPRHKVCGEFLSPEAQSTLRGLGLYSATAALTPVRLDAVQIISSHGVRLRRPLPGEAWGVSRYQLDAALADAAAAQGADVWMGTTAVSRVQQGEHVEVRLRRQDQDGPQGRTDVQARTVIMAYGRRSLPGLSSQSAGDNGRLPLRYVGVKRHYTVAGEGGGMPPQVELYLFPGGYAGLNPVEGGRINLCLLASYNAFAAAGRSLDGMINRAAAGNRALAQRLAQAQPVAGSECAVAPVDTGRPAVSWDGAANLGDAAVMLPPLCGDGMAMALRSAELCAPLADAYLRGTLSLPGWADAYQRLWTAEFGPRVAVGRWLQSRLAGRGLLADLLLATGVLMPPLADYLIHATRGPAT
jgi:flavin-dependent dehydrogenase